MNNKNLQNILQVIQIFEPSQNSIDFTISSKDYGQYMVINPKVSTFMSWINISEEIGNNKIKISNGNDFETTSEESVKIALKTRKSYYIYDDPETAQQINVNCFNQGILINPQLNCFTNNTLVWCQNENYIYNIDGSFNSYFFDPNNFENGSIYLGNNVFNGANNRIRQKNKYIVNGSFFVYIIKNASIPNIGYWAIEVYDGSGTYVLNLSIDWQPISTNLSSNGTIVNIPFNQNYSIRFVFKPENAQDTVSPIDLDKLVKKDIIDTSDAAKWLFSEPIPTKKDNFFIPFNTFLVGYVFNIYKYDKDGNYLGSQTSPNPASGIQVNTPGTRYVILALFSNTQFNLTYNSPSTQPSFPTNSGVANRSIAQNWINGINFFASAPIISDTITIPDGYYSGIASTSTQTGFSYIQDLFNNNIVFQSFSGLLELNQLNFKTRWTGQFFIEFLGTSNRIFGFYNINELFVDLTPVISSDPIDLFSDGRFSQINLVLSNLASNGYINESNSLISIPASANYGSLIRENDISYKKLLPRTANLNTLSIRITDGFGLPIKLNDRLFLRFEILCYSD